MIPRDFNPPLRVGQILVPRNGEPLQPCRIVEGYPRDGGMVWLLEPVAGGPLSRMTLSEIYAKFQFDN